MDAFPYKESQFSMMNFTIIPNPNYTNNNYYYYQNTSAIYSPYYTNLN